MSKESVVVNSGSTKIRKELDDCLGKCLVSLDCPPATEFISYMAEYIYEFALNQNSFDV